MLQSVGSNIFRRVGEALGFKGNVGGHFGEIETKEPFATVPLSSFMSEELTVTQWFAGRVTSVGAAGFENFDLFTTTAIAHPENAFLVNVGLEINNGTPDAAMLIFGTASPQFPLKLWESIDGLFLTTVAPDQVTFPFWIPSKSPAANGTPVAFSSLVDTHLFLGLDPNAIGDIVDWKMLIHSAPQGVQVWGV